MKRGIFLGILIAGVLIAACPASAQTTDATVLTKYKILEPHATRAGKYFLAGDLVKCESEAAVCLKELPEHHEGHFLLAQILYKKGEFEAALVHVAAAEQGFIRLKRITESIQKRKLEKQMAEKEDLVADAEAWEDAYETGNCRKSLYKIKLEETLGKISDDGKYGESVLAQTDPPVPPEYRYFHGNCFFRLRNYPGAEAQYKAALRLDPRHANATVNLINLFYIEGRLDEAKTCLDQADANKIAVLPGLRKAVLEARGK